MEGRTLRNRTVAPHSEDEAPVFDSESDWPHDQPELSSDSETVIMQPKPIIVHLT
jgi:hypothetical protein